MAPVKKLTFTTAICSDECGIPHSLNQLHTRWCHKISNTLHLVNENTNLMQQS